jgi:hypothetical protein
MKMITWQCNNADCGGTVDVAECYDAGSCPLCEGPMHETMNYEEQLDRE